MKGLHDASPETQKILVTGSAKLGFYRFSGSPALKYMKFRFPDCEAWQISAVGIKDFIADLGIRVCFVTEFLGSLV